MKAFTVLALSCILVASGVSANLENNGRKLLDGGAANTNARRTGTDTNRGRDYNNKGTGSVKGDPVLTAFDGQHFEFHGRADHFYNLASEPGVFQLSTKLKPAVMFDHNGTYMRGVALQQKGANVIVETGADFEESITVSVNGEALVIEDAATESTTRVIALEDGTSVEVKWELFAPEVGPLVTIRTASIEVGVSLTAPFPDAGGVLQPCYLNANVTLLRQPGQDLQGILGETYNTQRAGVSVPAPKYPLFDDSKYELTSYFGNTLAQTMASLAKMLAVQKPAGSLSR